MQLYFIRHAQSKNNALYDSTADYTNRSEDPELTDKGHAQARLLATYLSERQNGGAPDGADAQNKGGFGLTHLYSSLMVRAVSTATCISQALGIAHVAWPDIHEGGGIYLDDPVTGLPNPLPGRGRAFFKTHYPDLVLPDWLGEDGWWNRPFETRAMRRERARSFLNELFSRHSEDNDRVAVISHGGFYNHVLAVIMNLSDGLARPTAESIQSQNAENSILGQENELWFVLNNTAITRIDFTPGEIKMVYMNRIDHLPDDLIT